MKRLWLLIFAAWALAATAQRTETLLQEGWRFHLGDAENAQSIEFNDKDWEIVTIPHDWAIKGPFDRKHDLQKVAVRQNGETLATWKTGRTGGLPWAGIGWYRTTFDVSKTERTTLLFDGAMSEAHVYVNGHEAIFWPYGYNSFYVDVTDQISPDGKNNTLAVRLQNREQSSRWYPGAGLYRNVHVIQTKEMHIPVWGTYITTPHVEKDYASFRNAITVENPEDEPIRIVNIVKYKGNEVTRIEKSIRVKENLPVVLNLTIPSPQLWSPETPNLYESETRIYNKEGQLQDTYVTSFGIRTIEYIAHKGFFLNGMNTKFHGVCLHHDLGPLGSAVNESAIRHQLSILKDMGCNAIRTSHNMPTPELVRLCDEMGFMMMVEPFDEWDEAKCENGYHRFFKEWAERDMINMLHNYRNHPSVVMWSIGNEIPNQWKPSGLTVARFLQDICHREDPTRPVTCGQDQVAAVLENGFAANLDIPGFNYRTKFYVPAYDKLPQGLILGSETASTISSRGTYMFPAELKNDAMYDNHQSTGYDLEACWWSNVPDIDFALEDDYEWEIGQFVWTGFDYLGEPSPYDTDAWPSHSSVFGIVDLASLPKDRFYLYQSKWSSKPMLHVLPHWTWPDRKGEVTPVMAYSTYDEAELFVNGVSQGRLRKLSKTEAESLRGKDSLWLQRRYRFIWNQVKYEPGEITVKAYDKNGSVALTKTISTAGKPHHLQLTCDRTSLSANGQDLAYITVSIVDKNGNLCPHSTNLVRFSVNGEGAFRAAANGDPTNLDLFHLPQHHAYAGQLTAIVQTTKKSGSIVFSAKAGGLKGSITLKSE